MQRKVMTGHKSGLFILLALFFLISCLIMPPPATCQAQDTADTTLTGRITAANTGAGIGAVSVRLSSLANETLHEVKTDDFGFYRMDGLEAGSYIVTAEHPAYQTAQEINFAVNPGANCWDRALQPISGGASLFDVYVEVVCATSGIHLADVPVAITVKRDSDNQFVTYNQATDADGVAHLTGMPAGVYTFTINYDIPNVAAKIGGWDGYISVPFEDISGPHWADVRLKPVYNQLNVTVRGYDVVKDQADMPLGGVIVEASGCDPADDSNVLLPPQVGVSGLSKDIPYWDNAMAGKVKFDKLIPLTWLLETKKLGYENKNLFVRSNSSGGLMQTDVTINIPLEDTKLWVWLDSPYNDPEMLEGLDVILEGISGQNTEGIARRVQAVYSTEEGKAYALFNNILPGNYDVRVDDTADKTVPIEVDGKKIYDGAYGGPLDKQFTVRFTAQETFYAENDKDTDVTLQLVPEKMKLSGCLYTVEDEKDLDCAYPQYAGAPAAGKNVEIRLSEYMTTAFPDQEKLHQVVTDASGNFSVELLPGLYGVVVTGMDDYWGNFANLMDAKHPDDYTSDYHAWPYYQRWPYSYNSALAFKDRGFMNNEPLSAIGGMPVSSGQALTGSFIIRKDWFNYDVELKRGWEDPTEHLVVAINRSGSTPKVVTQTFDDIKNGGQLTLNKNGQVSETINLATTAPSFKHLTAGNYSLTLTHPRYTQSWTPTTTYFDFPAPGLLPSTAFPENYNSTTTADGPNPWPLLSWDAYYRPEYKLPGAIKVQDMMTAEHRVRVMKWTQINSDPVQWDYVEVSEQAYPRFIKTSYTGDLLFETERKPNDPTALSPLAYVPAGNYDAYFWWPAGGNPFDDNAEHCYMMKSDANGYLSGDIYIGGESPTAETGLGEIKYTLAVEARNNYDRNETIDGVEVVLTIDGADQSFTSGQTLENQTVNVSSITVKSATHSFWTYTYDYEAVLDSSAATPRVKVIVYMQQAIGLLGEVKDNVTGKAVTDIRMRLENMAGNTPTGLTPTRNENGTFSNLYGLTRKVYILTIEADGYEPFRVKLDPANAVDYTSQEAYAPKKAYLFTGDNAVKLVPLAKPDILEETLQMDRFGAFIPGVKRSGKENTLNLVDNTAAEEALTMRWSLQVKPPAAYAVTLPKFDQDGNSAGTEQIQIKDEVAEVWVIDRRSFADRTFKDKPTDVVLPSTDAADYAPQKVLRWLQDFNEGTLEEVKYVYHTKVASGGIGAVDSATGNQIISGQIPLWTLPPDDFRPTFVVVTKLGATEVYNFDYSTGTIANLPAGLPNEHALVGLRIPDWFAGVLDTAGYAATASTMFGDAAREQVQNRTPTGSIMPVGTCTAVIEVDDKNCLNYDYSLGVELVHGSKTPSNGMLAAAPGMLGFSVYGSLQAKLAGMDKQFTIKSLAGLGAATVDASKLVPKAFGKLGVTAEFDPMPKGEFEIIDDYVFDNANRPMEKAIIYAGRGEVGVKFTASGFQLLGPIPKVGWVLLALKNSGALDAGAVMKGLVGVRGLQESTTVYPQETEHYTISGGSIVQQAVPLAVDEASGADQSLGADTSAGGDASSEAGSLEAVVPLSVFEPMAASEEEPRQLQRNFIGGQRDSQVIARSTKVAQLSEARKIELGLTDTNTALEICTNFGLGLYVNTAGGNVGAEGAIEVAGENSWTSKPSLLVTVNPNRDAPIITEVSGDVRATADLYARLWIMKFQKSYVWGSIPIEYQFTTEPSFSLIPMQITESGSSRGDYDVSAFYGTPVLIIDDFLVIGDYSDDSAGSAAFTYADMATKGGNMRLMASQGGSSNGTQGWQTPVAIASTDGAVISHDIVSLPEGAGYMAAWTEIAATDLEKTTPPAVLKYSQGDSNFTNWSTPQVMANLDEVPTNLELLLKGNDVAAIYLATDEGPASVNRTIYGSIWDGSEQAWNTPAQIAAKNEVKGYAACVAGNSAEQVLLVYVNGLNELQSLQWNGSSVSGAVKLADGAGNDLVLVSQDGGEATLLWSGLNRGIGMFSYTGSGFLDRGLPLSQATPNELAAQRMGTDKLLVVWTGGDGEGLMSATLGMDGSIVQTPALTVAAETGRFYSPEIVSTTDAVSGETSLYTLALHENDDVELRGYKYGANSVDECFIATAAFGSKLEPAVVLLRQFRDRFLLTNAVGRAFVDFYYRHSPPLANLIAKNEALRTMTRGLLLLPIAIAWSLLHPFASALLLLALLGMAAFTRRVGRRLQS